MYKLSSPKLMKNINEQRVLNLIFHEEPIYRVEIAEKTGLTQQTITNIVSRLLKDQIVLEGNPAASTGGRKPIPLRINRSGMYAVGVELTVKRIRVVCVDFNQELVRQYEQDIEFYTDGNHTLQVLVEGIEELLNDPLLRSRTKGIGISVPGLIDSSKGLVHSAPGLHWNQLKLADALEERFGLPAAIENDVNVIAEYENAYGLLAASENNITIYFDYGIGGAIVVRKEISTGSHRVAGEFGHTKAFFGDKAVRCHCGGMGCLTTKASIGGMEKTLGIPLVEIERLLRDGDAAIVSYLNEMAETIGGGLANIVTFFNPDHLLLTGKLMQTLGFYMVPLIEQELRRVVPKFCEGVQIVSIMHAPDRAKSAASLAINHMFQTVERRHLIFPEVRNR
ncbi:ROK family transcriptional regulator [Paenibacillus filicis]|uniref:ROK family transcriptional regulator n=1 Tax=Paenibacillus gyeongsangnamensis TaxID=3388067 RepID=A0ABT4QGR6_9BACL|nr:ROK family transcriptional regulator [Paenibacillus filicis]MCZ8516056.1 ROK family transcriptional regulator [Paenibacillus filicis]